MTHPPDCMCPVCGAEDHAAMLADLAEIFGATHPVWCECPRAECVANKQAYLDALHEQNVAESNEIFRRRFYPDAVPSDSPNARTEAVERGKGVVELDERRVKGIAS